MTVYHHAEKIHSPLHKPMFHDVTATAREVVERSGVRAGMINVYSQHTTCSIIIQEEAHDALHDGTKYLLQDMLNRMEELMPTCRHEGQYLHPGPEHLDHAVNNLDEQAVWSMNTDAHLRSCLIGRSETIPIIDGQIELGEFGLIYFADFDAVRPRDRRVHFQVVGE